MHPQLLDTYASAFRREDDIRIAEQHRFQRHVLGINTNLPQPCCSALAWLGHRIVAWGRRLESKYGDIDVGPKTPLHHV